MKSNKSDLIKVIGMLATIVGVGATLVSSWVEDKKMEERINDQLDCKLDEYFKNQES